jgi:hypothetical protein
VEAGVTDGWRKYVGLEGAVVGIDRFGESAPAGDVYKFLGVDAKLLRPTPHLHPGCLELEIGIDADGHARRQPQRAR